MKIEPGYYRTRDGRKARVLCTDAPGRYPVIGYVEEGSSILCEAWSASGEMVVGAKVGGDLLAPWTQPKTVTVTPWAFMLGDGSIFLGQAPRGDFAGILGASRGQPITVVEGVFDA
jgi:hypothetical protein